MFLRAGKCHAFMQDGRNRGFMNDGIVTNGIVQ